MQVDRVVPSGYCKGVINAILLARKTRESYPDQPIYIMGMLVHNRYVVDAFSLLGVTTLSDPSLSKSEQLARIKEGVVIFTAHGIDPKIRQYALDKGLIVVDATCDDVTRNADLCRHYLAEGYDVIYIGKANHPESEAVLALSDHIHLITRQQDLEKLYLDNQKLVMTNQTTMSMLDTAALMAQIKEKYPYCISCPEICSATRMRQQALLDLQDYDCLVVVGDPQSNNTAQLASIAGKRIKKVIRVETARDLLNYDFSDCEKVAVTSGASTPSYLTSQVIGYLRTADSRYLEIDLNKILQL